MHTDIFNPDPDEVSRQMKKVREFFSHIQQKSSATAQYSSFFEGLELLFTLGNSQLLSIENKRDFIQLSLDAYKQMCAIGDQNQLMIQVLFIAKSYAVSIGDFRSGAICDFQLSALLLAFNELKESTEAFKRGLYVVEELGDIEISDTAALHSVAYHTLRGQPQKTLQLYDQVYRVLHQEPVDPFVISFAIPVIALAAAFTGRFRLGIRILVGGRQAAQISGAKAVDLALQVQLGWLFAASGDLVQARHHMNAGLNAPEEMHMPISRYWTERNNAYLLYAEGDLKASYKQMCKAQQLAAGGNPAVLFYHAPWLLEMLYAFHSEEFEPISGFQYESEMEKILQGPNLHLKGTAYRLMASDAMRNGASTNDIIPLLENSRECLQKAGGVMELGKTLIEFARVHIRDDDVKGARPFIHDAWEIYAHTAPNLFPGNIHHFLKEQLPVLEKVSFWPGHKRLMRVFDQLDFSIAGQERYKELLNHVSTFFGGERSNLLVGPNPENNGLQLELLCSLGKFDKESAEAERVIAIASASIQRERPRLEEWDGESGNVSFLCIPFRAIGKDHVICISTSYRNLILKYTESEILSLAEHVGLQLSFIVTKFLNLEKTHKEDMGLLTGSAGERHDQFLFNCEPMRKLVENAKTAARLDVPILLLGETGVGKEVMAQFIHKHSRRNHMPFVTIDLSCISESLIESELFGHEKGAFTGADKQRKGCVELANDGTLFIDEIGEIPLAIQTKLLRVLQEKTFKRLGGMRSHLSNFRLIAATNRDLKQAIKNKQFREDLYHRIHVVPLTLPPLRERQEDILQLATSFLKKFSEKHNLPIPKLDFSEEICLKTHSWPGNIRELKNLLERVVVLQDASLITKMVQEQEGGQLEIVPTEFVNIRPTNDDEKLMTLNEMQATYIKYILHKTNGKIGGKDGAAGILGMNRSTLYNRMKKLNISFEKIS